MPYRYSLVPKNPILEYKLQHALNHWAEYHKDHTIDQYDSNSTLVDQLHDTFNQPDKPLMYKRFIQGNMPLMPQDFDRTFYEVDKDLEILYGALNLISDNLISHFNYAQTDKLRSKNKLRRLSSMTNEFHLLAHQQYMNVNYITNTFSTTESIDYEFMSGLPAQVLVDQGVVTLGFYSSINISPDATVHKLEGNGQLGNAHVINPDIIEDESRALSHDMFFLEHKDPHDNPRNILDSKPDTWVEYQRVNIPNDIKQQYPEHDFSWATGQRMGDTLRMRLIIKLEQPTRINWLHIDPYLPPRYARGHITVHSINTSLDGIKFYPIYEHHPVLHTEIDLIAVSSPYIIPDFVQLEAEEHHKLASQGIWNFPSVDAQYVEIVLDQHKSTPELFGITVYEETRSKRDSDGILVTTSTRVPESSVSEEVQEGLPGQYNISDDVYIDKSIDVVAGWRYCLGLRDINIYHNTFAESSELVSKPHKFDKPIEAIAMHVSEYIPEEFIEDIGQRYDWVEYLISFNDVDWYPISPIHHRAFGDEHIPPKIYTINTNYYDDPNELPHNIQLPEDVYQVRVKIILHRPEDLELFTPLIEEYTLRVVFKE